MEIVFWVFVFGILVNEFMAPSEKYASDPHVLAALFYHIDQTNLWQILEDYIE